MEIKRIENAPGYYAVDNGFVYKRSKEDNKLHKLNINICKRQHCVSIKVNGKYRTMSLGQIIAKAFLNAKGNFTVYRINSENESYAPSNLRVKYRAKPHHGYDNTPKGVEVRFRGSITPNCFKSIMEAARELDINDTQIRSIIDTPRVFKGYSFRSIV